MSSDLKYRRLKSHDHAGLGKSFMHTENKLLNMSLNTPKDNIENSGWKVEQSKSELDEFEQKQLRDNFKDWLYTENKPFLNLATFSDIGKDYTELNVETKRNFSQKEIVTNNRSNATQIKENLVLLVASTFLPNSSLKSLQMRERILNSLAEVAEKDPEFILKVALYCRQELNIRTTTNFLLAYAAQHTDCKIFLSKYFSSAVILPSDWLEVVEHYKSLKNTNSVSLPHALRCAMIKKFSEFDEYQLAKYNKEKKSKTKQKTKQDNENSDSDEELIEKKSASLKYLIRNLHISEPVNYVLSLLGKRYPADALEFRQFGMTGDWDQYLAGTRMRLAVPYTWETELSKTPFSEQVYTWQNLIDSRKLPYMATLRNLRNLVLTKISKDHIEKVVKYITSENAIASSRQMPFRFFNAFAALENLSIEQDIIKKKTEKLDTKIKKCIKQKAKEERIKRIDFNLVTELKMAVEKAFEISLRLNLPVIRGSTLILANLNNVTTTTEKSLPTAYNKHETLIVLLTLMCMSSCEDFEAYFQLDDNLVFNAKSFNKLMPVTGSILKNTAESADFFKSDLAPKEFSKLQPINDTAKPEKLPVVLENILSLKKKFTTMLVIGSLQETYNTFVKNYHSLVGPMKTVLNQHKSINAELEEGWLVLPGYSDQILRFVAEVGNKALVNHVDSIDHLYNLRTGFKLPRNPTVSLIPKFSIELPASRQRTVRVFVSSTFRDMYGERDLLSGLVFPALRKQLAKLDCPVHLNEIDLRWGVPESASRTQDALRICLENVATADCLILLLGDRYGWSPKQELVQALPPKLLELVMKNYHAGASITEMETNLFLEVNENAKDRIFVFLRSANCLDDLPSIQKPNFTESSKEKRLKLDNFKAVLKSKGLIQLADYPAVYSGVIASNPMMGNLQVLADSVFHAVYSHIIEIVDSTPQAIEAESEGESMTTKYLTYVAASVCPRQLREVLKALYIDLGIRGQQVHRARAQATDAVGQARGTIQPFPLAAGQKRKRDSNAGRDGGILCLVGSRGSGKTTLITAVSTVLSNPSWQSPIKEISTFSSRNKETKIPNRVLSARVFVHLVMGAYTSSTQNSGLMIALPQLTQLKQMLDAWNKRIIKELADEDNLSLQKKVNRVKEDSMDVVGDGLSVSIVTFQKLLNLIGEFIKNEYIFIIDSIDCLQPGILEWLPEVLPSNVQFVVSFDGDSTFADALSNRPDVLYLRISTLSIDEKSAAIRCYFAQYGKMLSETGFGSQLKKLVKKRDCGLPLYLKMACDELRIYSSFETLNSDLLKLPERLSDLVGYIVSRASVACGESLIKTALVLILLARRPIHSSQLQRMLNLWLAAQKDPELACIFSDDQKEDHELPSPPAPHLSHLALQVLLSQLQPLLAGFDIFDSKIHVNEAEDDFMEVDGDEKPPNFNQSGRLRFCSAEVIRVIRDICFGESLSVNRFGSIKRIGYTRPSYAMSRFARKKTDVDSEQNKMTVKLDNSPTELQAFMLLFIEFQDDIFDALFYGFHAKQFSYIRRKLANLEYIQKKAVSQDIPALIEEFMGFNSSKEEYATAWLKTVNMDYPDNFRISCNFVLQSSRLLEKFPQLTTQLLADQQFDAQSPINIMSPYSVTRCSRLARDYLRSPQMVANPKSLATTTVSALTISRNGQLIAVGSATGSISLINAVSGKDEHTFYGHTAAVNDVVFIECTASSGCVLLYSVSSDATSVLWKIVNAGSSLVGMKVTKIERQHSRAITCCAVDTSKGHLVTAGLDGRVNLYALRTSVDMSNEIPFDLDSFKDVHWKFNTQHQPINAMILVGRRIIVGCWTGCIWVFNVEERKTVKAQIYSSVNDQANEFVDVNRDANYYKKWSDVIGRHSAIVSLAFSGFKQKSQALIASMDFAGEVLVLDARSLNCLMRLDARNSIREPMIGRIVFFTPPGEPETCLLAHVGGRDSFNGAIQVWNLTHATHLRAFNDVEEKASISCGTLMPDGKTVIVSEMSGDCRAVDFSGNAKYLAQNNLQKTRAQSIAICLLAREEETKQTALLVYGSASGDVNFMGLTLKKGLFVDKVLGRPNQVFSHAIGQQAKGGGEAGGTLCVAVSESGVAASGGGDSSCWFYFCDEVTEAGAWKLAKSLRTNQHSAGVCAVALRDLHAASGGKDGMLVLYKVDEQTQTIAMAHKVQQAHMDWITAIAISSLHETDSVDVRKVFSGGNDNRIVVWSANFETGDVTSLFTSTDHSSGITHFSILAGYLVSASADGHISVWNVESKFAECLRQFKVDSVVTQERSIFALCLRAIDVDALLKNSIENVNEEITQTTTSSGWKPRAISPFSSGILKHGPNLELVVGTMGNDGGYSVDVLAPFKPKFELAFLGHPNVGPEGINLSPITDEKTQIRLISVGGNAPDVRMWNWPALNTDQGERFIQCRQVSVISHPMNAPDIILTGSLDGSVVLWHSKPRDCQLPPTWKRCAKFQFLGPVTSMGEIIISATDDHLNAFVVLLAGGELYEMHLIMKKNKSEEITFESNLEYKESKIKRLNICNKGYSIFQGFENSLRLIIGCNNGIRMTYNMSKKGEISFVTSTKLSELFGVLTCIEGCLAICDRSIVTLTEDSSTIKTLEMQGPGKYYFSCIQAIRNYPAHSKVILASCVKVVGEIRTSMLALLNLSGELLSSYDLSCEEIVFCQTPKRANRTSKNKCLVIVGTSDGILRYIEWNLEKQRVTPLLKGLFPTGRMITQLTCSTLDQLCVGFDNGDMSVYKLNIA